MIWGYDNCWVHLERGNWLGAKLTWWSRSGRTMVRNISLLFYCLPKALRQALCEGSVSWIYAPQPDFDNAAKPLSQKSAACATRDVTNHKSVIVRRMDFFPGTGPGKFLTKSNILELFRLILHRNSVWKVFFCSTSGCDKGKSTVINGFKLDLPAKPFLRSSQRAFVWCQDGKMRFFAQLKLRSDGTRRSDEVKWYLEEECCHLS